MKGVISDGKILVLAILFAMLSTLVLPIAADVAQAQTQGIPVTGSTPDGGTVTGTFDITRFVLQGGQIFAVGNFTGQITDAAGNVIAQGTQQIRLPVTALDADCDILHLELGPLDLDLLGLEVHLDRIVLDIDADPSGGLLGQLLCALANALDGGTLRGVVNLLNQILRVLG